MFQGSIPQAMRNILAKIVESWAVDHVHVGCSGNFTVERILAELEVPHIFGCDVTIYSCAIGNYLAQQPFRIALKDDFKTDLAWLAPYLSTQASALATLQLCSQFFQGLKADGSWKDNAYYTRILAGYREQWSNLHEHTVSKIEMLPFTMEGFFSGDAAVYVREVPDDHGFISYPPFWAGGYEDMWAKLDLVFDWDAPTYQIMGEEEIAQYIKDITQRKSWAFGVPVILDEYRSYLSGLALTTNRGVPIYIYASHGPRHVVLPRQKLEPLLVPRLLPGFVIGDSIRLAPLTSGQFAAVRSQYMNPNIPPASADAAFGVIVDEVLIGVFAYSDSSQSFAKDAQTMYLLTDFPVAPTDYPKLSKLVLHAALSTEAQRLAERVAHRRIRKMFTTAFSNKPVSMKYRGLFKVYSRKDLPEDDPYNYAINYVADAGQWSLAEGLTRWKEKYTNANH